MVRYEPPDGCLAPIGTKAEYEILRHYDLQRRLLRETLAGSVFPADQTPLNESYLAIGGNQVVLVSKTGGKVVELSENEKLRKELRLPDLGRSILTGAAVTSAGIFLSFQGLAASDSTGIYRVDILLPLETGAIREEGQPVYLMGSAGDELVVRVTPRRVNWLRVAQLQK